MVLLSDTDEAGATQIAEAIRARMEGTGAHVLDAGVVFFIVSVGCTAAWRASLPSRNALTKAAGDALYETKREGHNRVDCATVAQLYVSTGPDLQTEQSRKPTTVGVDWRLVYAIRAKAPNQVSRAAGRWRHVTP